MSFSKIFQILFIVGSTFLIFIPEYLNNSWWCFSSSFSDFEDRRRVPLKSLPVLPKIHGSSFMPSSHNCFRLWEFFSPIWRNLGVFSVWFFGAHHLIIIHSSFQLSFSKSYRCIIQVFSNQLVISSFTYIYIPSSIFIRSPILPGELCLFYFHFQLLRWFGQDFSSFVFISIYSLFQSYRWFVEDLLKFALYLS